ncbi:MAG: T9SS type A sorting domain-containing protein, partial [Hymenobacter sp.]
TFTLFPNPAASATSLSFGLPRAAHVELVVSDALGRTVDKVDAGQLAAGPQTLRWSRHGQAAGLYFFRLSFDGQAAGTRQVALTE